LKERHVVIGDLVQQDDEPGGLVSLLPERFLAASEEIV
jgi:hypothetical protein